MVFLVDTDGNGETDHFVTVVGYRDEPSLQYGCLDTWPPADQVRWEGFQTMDNGVPWGVWVGWSFQLSNGENNDPLLYNAWVNPRWQGTTATYFEYTVDYHDVDDNPPSYVRVYIDGSPHDMTLWNGVPESGEYRYVTQLDSGSHNFYFTTSDNNGGFYQTATFTGPNVDVPPPGSFEILDRLINDSYELASYNNQDGIIHSGEVIGIRPRIKFDESASVTATRIDMTLSSDSPSLEVWSGDRRYPDMAPGDIRYPEDGKYFQVVIDKDCQGTYYLDADLEWKEGDTALNEHFPNAIELNIQPAPWLNLINEEWDFGVAKPGDIVNYSLTVRNIGTGVLQVTDIDTPGDTTAVPSSFPLSAGASQNVQVSINTSSIPSGTRITRDIHVVSNGRSEDPTEDEHLIITGLVSDTLPFFKIPSTVNLPQFPDISGSWIVWHEDRNGDGTWDIFAYNISTGEEIQIPSSQYNQGNPKISGNLIAWRDTRNWDGTGEEWYDQSDVYGYDLSIDQEFAITNSPGRDYVVGISGNLIAVACEYEALTDPWTTEKVYNLLVFEYQGSGQCTQIYSTEYMPGTGTQSRPTFGYDSDFGEGLLVFELGEVYWEDVYWLKGHWNTYKIDFASGESTPIMISTVGSSPSDYSAASHKFVYIESDTEGDDVIWIWPGNTQITPSLDIDYEEPAFNGRYVVYAKYPDQGLFYWDLNTFQEELVTDQLLNEQDARMDGNGLVWYAQDASSQWYLYYSYFDLPDVSVSSVNITFSNESPIEGGLIDISVIVQNSTDYDRTSDITVRLFDGDPNIAGIQLGTDYTIVGGISAHYESEATFTNIPVGLEGCHEVFVLLQVDGMDIYANNKASKELEVQDADVTGPSIFNVVVTEFNGDGDGLLEDNEQIWIIWQAEDDSGVNSCYCNIEDANYPATGTYFIIVGPYESGSYEYTIHAIDGDTESPETAEYSGSFDVAVASGPCDINNSGEVDLNDYAFVASRWLDSPCSMGNRWCNGADINHDTEVNPVDLSICSENWLKEQYFKFYDFPLDDDPGWTADGEWEFGQPAGLGGLPFPNPDPTSGYTGTNVYGVNLNGNYNSTLVGAYYVTAGPLDCSDYHNIILRFARWLNTDYLPYVANTIEVSLNGSDWNIVWEHTGLSPISDNSWQIMEYDISSPADNQPIVYIRWGYEIIDNHANPYSGWNLDDIELWGNQ